MKKNAIVLLLCVLLLITACGQSNSKNGAGNEGSATGTNTNEANNTAKDQTVLKVYTNAKGEPGEPMMNIIEAFNAQSEQVKVEHVALVQNNDSREMLQKLDILASTGEEVDIILMNNEGYVLERAGNGMLYPLDEFYEQHSIDPIEEYYRNPMFDGKYYGAITDASYWYVAMNEDHLKAAGLETPSFDWTWEDFKYYAKQLTDADAGRYGAYFHTFGEYANIIAYTDFQNPQLREDGSLLYNDPSFQYFFELRRAMEVEDQSARPLADILASQPSWATNFMTGTASMLPIASYSLDEAFLNTTDYPRDFKITFAPLPRSSADVEPGLTNISGSFLTIHKNSKHKEAAFDFIKFATMEGAEQSGRLPGWKKVDGEKIIEQIVGDKSDIVDVEALKEVFFSEQVRTMPSSSINVSYQQQLKKVAEAGINKFLLDQTSFEEALEYMLTEGQTVINNNQ